MRIAEQFFHRRASGGKLCLVGDKKALLLDAGEKADRFCVGQRIKSRRRLRLCRELRRHAAIRRDCGAGPDAKLDLPRVQKLGVCRRYAEIHGKYIGILRAVCLCGKADRKLRFDPLQPLRILADIEHRSADASLDPDAPLQQRFGAQIHRGIYVQNTGDVRQRIGNDRFERLLAAECIGINRSTVLNGFPFQIDFHRHSSPCPFSIYRMRNARKICHSFESIRYKNPGSRI